MSNSDLQDLKEVEASFERSHSADLLRNKFAIHEYKGKPCLSILAKTQNGFTKKQIESYGGSVHQTINALATFNNTLVQKHQIKKD